jgi:hypothetical protein
MSALAQRGADATHAQYMPRFADVVEVASAEGERPEFALDGREQRLGALHAVYIVLERRHENKRRGRTVVAGYQCLG